MTKALEARWRTLWGRLGARGDAEGVYADLAGRYAERHRAYHTLAHIEHCLEEFDAARPAAPDPDAVEWAIWFHDAVYRPRSKDNEERSADLSSRTAKSIGLPSVFAKRVSSLILATRHDAVPADDDARLLVDVDLAILGQPPSRFAAYESAVREEYAWVPKWIFRKKRASILRSFLSRPSIYSTELFRKRYEAQARTNLLASLS